LEEKDLSNVVIPEQKREKPKPTSWVPAVGEVVKNEK